jgi:transposase
MILIPPSIRIYLAREPADMRRSFDGLSALVREALPGELLDGHLYCFRNKRGDRLKILYFDRTGLAIWYKKLEEGRYHWPEAGTPAIEMHAGELAFLLEGVDWKSVKRYKRFSLERARARAREGG